MCGIAGIFDPTNPPTEADLEGMNNCLTHRGPDADGIYHDGPVGLAHRRLAIIDPESGDQPVFNETGDVVVVFNGEIYNYQSLRSELRDEGHRFTTRTDTEVLVHLYEEHGTDFVSHLQGMFSFALWDADEKRLVLSRDPMGIKPLLVARDGNRIGFASELPALLDSSIEHGGLDETALAAFFALGYIPSPRTAFQNVRKVRPGERLVIDKTDVNRSCFYKPSIPARDPSIGVAARELRNRVEDAIEKRLVSDVPLGAFLSGGIDSSVVVGTMAKLKDDPVQTFTVGFDESQFDESWAAREVAEYHGTDHTEITASPSTVLDVIPDVLDRLGEPFADPSLIPTYVVARETSHDVTVALSGDGADELFAGYEKYRGELLSKYYRYLPSPVRENVIEPSINRLPASRESYAGELGRKAKKFTAGGETDLVRRHLGWVCVTDEESLSRVEKKPQTAAIKTLSDAHETTSRYVPKENANDITRIQAADTRGSLPDQLLTKVDLASMYNSLEVRVPFLSTDVVEYAFSLPSEYKITINDRKRVLKRAFDDVLPDSILERSKQGFDMPIGEWLKHELADEFRETVHALETDVIDPDAAMSIYHEHCTGRSEHGKFLWTTYVFARWMRRMQREDIL